MPKRTIPQRPEDFRFGMDNYNPTKKLAANVTQLLQNAFPGMTVKPRNAVEDTMVKIDALGDGTEHTLFRPHYLFINAGDKDFVFCWAENVTTTDKYHLEIWNITDDSRTKLIYGDWNRTDVYFSMEKLYDAVYITMNYEMGTNPESSYRTKNKIIEWIDSDWSVREMSIDLAARAGSLDVVDTTNPIWTERFGHRVVEFDGKLWLYGGNDLDGDEDDHVYWSTDGINWTQGVETGIGGRTYPAFVVYDDKMWIMGGIDTGVGGQKDSWWSSDGVTWTRINDNCAFGATEWAEALSYDGKLWLFNDSGYVYSSTDGDTFTEEDGPGDFGARDTFGVAVHDGKMWVVGGDHGIDGRKEDAWYSTDGSTWTKAVETGGYGARQLHCVWTYNNRLWVATGLDGGTYREGIYYSSNGVDWTEATATGIGKRYGAYGIAYNEKMFLLGGRDDDGTHYNKVYDSEDGVTWTLSEDGQAKEEYYDYAFTYVRRTDSASKLDAIANYDYTKWETFEENTTVSPDETLQTGTVSLSGTALSGGSTLFGEVLEADDFIRIDGTYKSYKVTSVTDNTNAVVVNDDGDSYTAKEYSLLPLVDDAITTSTYHPGVVEGVEDDDERRTPYMLAGAENRLLTLLTLDDSANIIDAVAQGATHLRIFRTLGHATKATAQGLSHRFLVDIALSGNGFNYSKVYIDRTHDDTLEGETNLLEATPFSVPPLGRYSIWDGEKYWIGGVPDNDGHWFYSVNPRSGDVSFDVEFPQKFASWFNLKGDYITCDPSDNQKDTGCSDLAGDIYFFKERKIFVLYDGNPLNKPVRRSNVIGCACPQTITKGEIPQLGGECILFISESGPAYITAGGKIKLLHEFTIDQLWPDKEGILRKSAGAVTDWYTRNKITATFWQNTWWIFFGDSQDSNCNISTNYCYGFRFGSDGKSIGPFQCTWPVASTSGTV